ASLLAKARCHSGSRGRNHMINKARVNITEYGEDHINSITVERLFERIELSELDRQIVWLKFGLDWTFKEIADEIGRKFLGRTEDNPLWEGSVRHRLKRILFEIRKDTNRKDYV